MHKDKKEDRQYSIGHKAEIETIIAAWRTGRRARGGGEGGGVVREAVEYGCIGSVRREALDQGQRPYGGSGKYRGRKRGKGQHEGRMCTGTASTLFARFQSIGHRVHANVSMSIHEGRDMNAREKERGETCPYIRTCIHIYEHTYVLTNVCT